ncbi:hypothetical protein ACXZ9C_10480 [Streptococcus agalactiae]
MVISWFRRRSVVGELLVWSRSCDWCGVVIRRWLVGLVAFRHMVVVERWWR